MKKRYDMQWKTITFAVDLMQTCCFLHVQSHLSFPFPSPIASRQIPAHFQALWGQHHRAPRAKNRWNKSSWVQEFLVDRSFVSSYICTCIIYIFIYHLISSVELLISIATLQSKHLHQTWRRPISRYHGDFFVPCSTSKVLLRAWTTCGNCHTKWPLYPRNLLAKNHAKIDGWYLRCSDAIKQKNG